jgi:hypothetical protein
MTDMQTMVRTEITVNGRSSLLAQGQDVDDLKRRIEAAMGTPGRFVDFTVVGNRATSALISPHAQVTFTIETVQFDPRDTGNSEEPYGGLYDL